ncbi:MAG: PaaI family thioesterase [Bryobacteraceae bacterium]|nr:PaaI family thioesterase [Bryobacteraceae bacterium]
MPERANTRKYKTLLEKYQDAARRGTYAFPLSRLIGFQLLEVAPGRAVIELQSGEQHLNPMGTLHGGVLSTIADTSMGIAHGSMLVEGETSTTIELKINFLRPVWNGRLRAIGRVVKHGKTLTLLESDVLDQQDRLVARASSTCMTLRGDLARGR